MQQREWISHEKLPKVQERPKRKCVLNKGHTHAGKRQQRKSIRKHEISWTDQVGAGGVGHDSQSVPGEIFARAHIHLIAEGQTSPAAEGDVEII